MFQILIVDDENYVIKGINSCVDWEGHGFFTPLEAYSGEQAIEILEKQTVDIVFTDIRMSAMSGLDLLAEIKARGYDCEVIILSCHNNFEYSRTALQNGACDYLFKPEMLPSDILAAAEAARERLTERRKSSRQVELLRDRLTQTLGYQKETFLRELTDGKKMNAAEFLQEARRLELGITSAAVNAVVFLLLDYRRILHDVYYGDEYLFKYGVLNVLGEVVRNEAGCVFFSRSVGEYVFLVDDSNSEAKLTDRLRGLARKVFEGLKKMGLHVSAGIGPLHCPVEQFQAVYEAAAACVRNQLRAGIIAFSGGIGVEDTMPNDSLLQMYREWSGVPETKVIRLFRAIKRLPSVQRDALIHLCGGVISLELHRHSPKRGVGDSQKLFAGLAHQYLLEDFERFMLEFARSLLSGGRREIQLAKAYMEKNLTQPTISLGEVASHVGMSRNYFSEQFKRETGKSFTEYLNEMRLQKAEELYANSSLKVYQIAEQVGYSDWRYLSRVYKRQRGYSLTDIRKKSTFSE